MRTLEATWEGSTPRRPGWSTWGGERAAGSTTWLAAESGNSGNSVKIGDAPSADAAAAWTGAPSGLRGLGGLVVQAVPAFALTRPGSSSS